MLFFTLIVQILLFILVVLFLVFGVAAFGKSIFAFDSYKKKADYEQEFRMSQDPEYRKFIEAKK